MKTGAVTFFALQSEFRDWLEANHNRAAELWVGFHHKGSGRPGIRYREALDEALAFGWIDGVRKNVDPHSYTIRFTPRKPGSYWSAVNTKRVGELIELGRMAAPGMAAFETRDREKTKRYSYERENAALGAEYTKQFKANARAWKFFEQQPPWYRRVATFWVVSAKKDETRVSRLARLIGDSERGVWLAAIPKKRSK